MGWIRLKKKQQQLYLYKKYKAQQELNKESLVTEKKKTEKLERKKPILKGIQTIAVTELKIGLGCSHMCRALYNYLDNSCIIPEEANIDEYLDSGYQYLILDLGDYNTLSVEKETELKRADKQILMCSHKEEYLEDLAEFVQIMDLDRYSFCFSFVPKENQSEVYDIMEDYDTYCLPIFNPIKLDGKMKKILKKII